MVVAPNVGSVHPRVMAVTVAAIRDTEDEFLDYEGRIISGVRYDAEQYQDFLKGRDPKTEEIINEADVVTYARTAAESAHGSRLATDTQFTNRKTGKQAPSDHPIWDYFGKRVEARGMEWGGRFKKPVDKPHVQMPNWKAYRNWSAVAESSTTSPLLMWGGLVGMVGLIWISRRR